MNGVVQGGWEYVIAAYVVTGAVLGLVVSSAFSRLRTELRDAARAKENR